MTKRRHLDLVCVVVLLLSTCVIGGQPSTKRTEEILRMDAMSSVYDNDYTDGGPQHATMSHQYSNTPSLLSQLKTAIEDVNRDDAHSRRSAFGGALLTSGSFTMMASAAY